MLKEMTKLNRTNSVKFKNYTLVLLDEQVSYYIDDQLNAVRTVSTEFTFKDLFELAQRIAIKQFGTDADVVYSSPVRK